MKLLYLILFIVLSSTSQAETKCMISTKDLTFNTPKAQDIANTFWQEEKEGQETIKRLNITYRDGSIAVIKHQFCSTYKFEAAYYMEEKGKPKSMEEIQKKLRLSLTYVAQKDNTQKKAIGKMIAELNESSFDSSEIVGASYNGFDSAYGDTGYSIIYFPINHSSLHSAAIFVEVGIGGVH